MCKFFVSIKNKKRNKNSLEEMKKQLIKSFFTMKEGSVFSGSGIAIYNDEKWKLCKKERVMISKCFMNCDDEIVQDNDKDDIVLGHIRNQGICPGNPTIENTHPFIYEDLVSSLSFVFCHHGYIKNFNENDTRNILIDILPESLRNEIRGETDSEVLFYLLISSYLRKKNGEQEEMKKKKDKVSNNDERTELKKLKKDNHHAFADFISIVFRQLQEKNILLIADCIFIVDENIFIIHYNTIKTEQVAYQVFFLEDQLFFFTSYDDVLKNKMDTNNIYCMHSNSVAYINNVQENTIFQYL